MAALLAALAVAALLGCGSGSNEDQVTAAVESYLDAFADGDGETACEQLSADGKVELVGAATQQLLEIGTIDCAEVVSQLAGFLDESEKSSLSDATVTEVEISGETATATLEGASVSPTLVEEDGTWKLDSGFAGG